MWSTSTVTSQVLASLFLAAPLVARETTGAIKDYSPPSSVSWATTNADLFGVNPTGNIWHKYNRGDGWLPNDGPGSLEIFTGAPAAADSAVSSASWGDNRVDFVYLDRQGIVRHKYWTGSAWEPTSGFDDLGRGPVRGLKLTTWGEGRLDIVGLDKDGHLLHKAWTGDSWHPGVKTWEDLGGSLVGEPGVASWGPGRLDIFGVTAKGQVVHKYWNSDQWQPSADRWEDLSADYFNASASPVVTTPGPGEVDVWTLTEDGELVYQFWDGEGWVGWLPLGGNFTTTPTIAHLNSYNIDIVGRDGADPRLYRYRHWDGSSWGPWYLKGGDFASEPAIIRDPSGVLQIAGIDTKGKLVFQVWTGQIWFPSPIDWYEIGDVEADGQTKSGDEDEDEGNLGRDPSPWSRGRDWLRGMRLVEQGRHRGRFPLVVPTVFDA